MLENFAGPTEPTFIIPGQLWFDTTNAPNDVLKVRNQANDAWNNVLTVGVDLDFGGFKGINVGDATDPTDAMNQQSSDARYVELAGDTMVGALSMSGNLINFVTDPAAPQDVATKNYVDTRFVELAGDTMTGDLILNADPTVALQAATKDYVDTEIISVGDVRFVNVLGDIMAGFLTLNADPTIALHAATKNYVDISVGAVGGDGVVFSGIFDGFTDNGKLTLSRTEALPDVVITGLSIHSHDANDIVYISEIGEHLDNTAPENTQLFSQTSANVAFDVAAKLINLPNKRQFAIGSDFAGSTLTLGFAYPTETNRLEVFVNLLGGSTGGRKLVADERGVAVIGLVVDSLTQTQTFPSSATGLSDDATLFTFDITVDGAGPTGISIEGQDAQVYGENSEAAILISAANGLVTAMNAKFVAGGVSAVATFNIEDGEIQIFSDTTGGASSVVIADTGLFAALTPETIILNWTGITGASLPTGVTPGAYFDVTPTSLTTHRFWFSDGSTTAPADPGTLVAIAFTGAETPQVLSDLVVAALIGSDADFVGATNGGGATPIITMTLASVGAVPDIVDGAVPTFALLFVSVEGVTTSITSIGGVDHDYSEDGPALADSTSLTLTGGAPAASDEFEVVRIK